MDRSYNLNGGFKPTVKRFADLDGPDYFPTPAWASYALIDNENFEGNIWECACGDGAISKVLMTKGQRIISSDLYNRGFGESGHDFLSSNRRYDNIITNPPYNSAEGFVEVGLKNSRKKLALLLRLAFLEGGGRCERIFSVAPPSRVWVFSERITFYPHGAVQAGTGTTAYAWFIWDKEHIGSTELKWIKPGYKSKYRSVPQTF